MKEIVHPGINPRALTALFRGAIERHQNDISGTALSQYVLAREQDIARLEEGLEELGA